MKEIRTFKDGPYYYDLNIGDRIAINSQAIELVDTFFTGPEGKGATASDGTIVLKVNEVQKDIILGSQISSMTLRIGAEMIRCFNTEPYRLKRQNKCWKLFHDARIFVSLKARLTIPKFYRFPLDLQNCWSRTSNYLTKYSGYYKWGEPTHPGVDIEVPIGITVISCCTGIVAFVGPYKEEDKDGSGGLGVIVLGDDNIIYGYWHLSATEVTLGERVRTGQLLGYSGNSGFEGHPDWPPHLHFEMWLLTGDVGEFQITEGRDYDRHLKYLWVPEGGICINPFPYLCEWYDND